MLYRLILIIEFSLGMVVSAPLHAEFPIVVEEGSQRSPEVIWFGDGYLVAWRGAGIWGTRVSHDGMVQDPGGFLIADVEGVPSISGTAGTDRCLLVFCAPRDDGAWTLNGVCVDHEGVPSPQVAYLSEYVPMRNPAVAHLDSIYLVVFEEYRYPQKSICFTRVSREGFLLDSSSTVLEVLNNWASRPKVTAGSTCFLVVWSDSCRVEAAAERAFGGNGSLKPSGARRQRTPFCG